MVTREGLGFMRVREGLGFRIKGFREFRVKGFRVGVLR